MGRSDSGIEWLGRADRQVLILGTDRRAVKATGAQVPGATEAQAAGPVVCVGRMHREGLAEATLFRQVNCTGKLHT